MTLNIEILPALYLEVSVLYGDQTYQCAFTLKIETNNHISMQHHSFKFLKRTRTCNFNAHTRNQINRNESQKYILGFL